RVMDEDLVRRDEPRLVLGDERGAAWNAELAGRLLEAEEQVCPIRQRPALLEAQHLAVVEVEVALGERVEVLLGDRVEPEKGEKERGGRTRARELLALALAQGIEVRKEARPVDTAVERVVEPMVGEPRGEGAREAGEGFGAPPVDRRKRRIERGRDPRRLTRADFRGDGAVAIRRCHEPGSGERIEECAAHVSRCSRPPRRRTGTRSCGASSWNECGSGRR